MVRQNLTVITIIVSIALVALVAVQLFWIKNAVRLKEDEFNSSVHDALNDVVFKLEKASTAAKIKKKFKLYRHGIAQKSPADTATDSYDKDKIKVKILEELSIDSDGVITSTIKEKQYNGDSVNNVIDFPAEISKNAAEYEKLKMDMLEKRAAMFSDIFDELISINIYEEYKPGIDTLLLDSLLKTELRQKGIYAEYSYKLSSIISSQLGTLPGNGVKDEVRIDLAKKTFTINLSPNNVFIKPTYLILQFPHEENYLLSTMWVMLSVSAIIILFLVLAFFYTINTIRKQKKHTQIKNDFISNMTHEFKTPISTIALAGEMLSDTSVPQTPEKINRFVGMIRDENKRLGTLVESILQTAILDKGDFKLKYSDFDFHEVVSSALEKIHLLVEQKKGILNVNLDAEKHLLHADKVHITNIVYNLLDNAIKYSKEVPEITLSTKNVSKGILLSVEDRGLGISKENIKKIFDQFYRVSTGNVHNIKGFGLGLSYVKAIVQKHGGEIQVESELNKGSTFKIYIPFNSEINKV